MYELAAVIGSGILGFTLCYLSMNIDKKHGALQILFLVVGLGMLLNTSGITGLVSKAAGATENMMKILDMNIRLMSGVIFITLLYIVLNFLMVFTKFITDKIRGKP